MSDYKILELLNAFTGTEKREFSKYLESPYFNQRQDVKVLWENLCSKKEEALGDWSRHTHSQLVQLMEAFLAQRAWEQSGIQPELVLAPVLRRKKLDKSLAGLYRRAEYHLENAPEDMGYYHARYALEWERYAARESNSRDKANNLAAVHQAFDVYCIAGKLRLGCLMEAHKAVYPVVYETTFLGLLVEYLKTSPLAEIPVIALYLTCYQALRGESEHAFEAFRDHLAVHGAALPDDERRTFLLLAINFCIRQANRGERAYIREAFQLYRIGLDSDILLENGRLGRFAYKNIVALALKLCEYDRAFRFIDEAVHLLEPDYRQAYRDYNMARVLYARGDYSQAMPLLARVDEADLLLNLDSRVMLLKMYFELAEFEACSALHDSFRVLLMRKKRLLGYHYAHHALTLRYFGKLLRLNFMDKKAVEDLRAALRREKGMVEQDWFLKVLDKP